MSSTPVKPGRPPVPRLVWWLVGLAVLVVAVVVVVLVALGNGAPVAASTSPAPSTASGAATTPAGPSTPAQATPSAAASPTAATSPAQTAPPATGAGDNRPTDPPVSLQDSSQPAPGVTVKLSSLTSVMGTASLPGEVGGPSLQVTVEVSNSTEAGVDLRGAVVSLFLGQDMRPAIELSTGEVPFPASVAKSSSATGVYLFNVPAEDRGFVTVEVDLATAVPVTLFQGAAPAA